MSTVAALRSVTDGQLRDIRGNFTKNEQLRLIESASKTAGESVEEIFLKGNLFACPSRTKDCVINRKLRLQQLLVVCV